jgi:hypothetical protein
VATGLSIFGFEYGEITHESHLARYHIRYHT